MFLDRSHKILAVGVVNFALLVALSGCGPASAQDSTAPDSGAVTATATCTPRTGTNTITRASGIVKSSSSNSLVITKSDGSSVITTLSSKTVVTQEMLEKTSALTSGAFVTISVTPSTDGSTYTADTIQLTSGVGGGQFGRGGPGAGPNAGNGNGRGNRNNPCRFQRNGTPGASGGFGRQNGGATNGSSNRLFGTVAQVSGNTLIITDMSNNNYSLVLTGKTQITQTQKVTVSALKVGQNVSVIGALAASSDTTATATTVSITLHASTTPSTNSNGG